MIKLRKIIISLGVLTACSCSNHSDDVAPLPNDGKESTVTLEIGSAAYSSVVDITRADPVVITEGSLGVSQTSTAFPYKEVKNMQYTYHGEPTYKWLVVLDDAMPLYKSDATICTYMPYDSQCDGVDFTLTSQHVTTTTEKEKDLLYSPNQTGANVNNKVIDVTLKHAYSKITINLVKGTYQADTERPGKITNIDLSNTMVYSDCSFDISEEVYSARNTGTVSAGGLDITLPEAPTTKEVSFLMVPSDDAVTYSDGITFAFTIDGLIVKATSTEFTQLLPGHNYKITATFNDSEISPTNPDIQVTVTDFVEVPYEGGTPIDVNPEPTPEEF